MATSIAAILREAQAAATGLEFIMGHAGQIARYEPVIAEIEKAASQFTSTGATEAIINGIDLPEVSVDLGISVRQSGVPSVGVWSWLPNGSVVAAQDANGNLIVDGVTYARVTPSAPPSH